jgi:5-methylcytosine-specific restriction endonuclease McrA
MADFSISASLRQAVLRRAFGCCEYCVSQLQFSPDPFSVEHTTPRAKGGSNELENIYGGCCGGSIGTHRGDRLPERIRTALLDRATAIEYPIERVVEMAFTQCLCQRIASFLDTEALGFADCQPGRGQ